MYAGFSACTGLLSSSHYILGWSFKLNGEAKLINLDFSELRHMSLIGLSVCLSLLDYTESSSNATTP